MFLRYDIKVLLESCFISSISSADFGILTFEINVLDVSHSIDTVSTDLSSATSFLSKLIKSECSDNLLWNSGELLNSSCNFVYLEWNRFH